MGCDLIKAFNVNMWFFEWYNIVCQGHASTMAAGPMVEQCFVCYVTTSNTMAAGQTVGVVCIS